MSIPTLQRSMVVILRTCTIRILPFADLRARSQTSTIRVISRVRCGHHSLFSEEEKQYHHFSLCVNCTLPVLFYGIWAFTVAEGLYPVVCLSYLLNMKMLRTEKDFHWSTSFICLLSHCYSFLSSRTSGISSKEGQALFFLRLQTLVSNMLAALGFLLRDGWMGNRDVFLEHRVSIRMRRYTGSGHLVIYSRVPGD